MFYYVLFFWGSRLMNIHRSVIHKHPQARQGFHNCSRRAFRPSPHNPVRGCLFWNQRNTLIMNPITGPTMQVSAPSCPCTAHHSAANGVSGGISNGQLSIANVLRFFDGQQRQWINSAYFCRDTKICIPTPKPYPSSTQVLRKSRQAL